MSFALQLAYCGFRLVVSALALPFRASHAVGSALDILSHGFGHAAARRRLAVVRPPLYGLRLAASELRLPRVRFRQAAVSGLLLTFWNLRFATYAFAAYAFQVPASGFRLAASPLRHILVRLFAASALHC